MSLNEAKKAKQIHADPQALSEAVAAELARAIADAVVMRGRCVVALAGGSTPRQVYERLSQFELPWSRVVLMFGDERAVGPDDPDSNYHMVTTALGALLEREARPTIRRVAGELGALEAARQYAQVVAEVMADEPFDVVLLGMGADGHVASIFPGTEAGTDDVVATTSPLPPTARVSLSLTRLANTRAAWVMVTGAAKAARVAEVMQGAGDTPAARLATKVALTWHLDRAAAGALDEGKA